MHSYSLKALFKFGAICFFLSICLVCITSLSHLRQAINVTDQIVDQSIVEMHFTMELQLALVQVAMPVNDYIIHANPAEQTNYHQQKNNVMQLYERLANVPTLQPEQRNILDKARQLWIDTEKLGNIIMVIKSPIGNPDAAEKMEQFDSLIDDIVRQLDAIHTIINQQTKSRHQTLHQIKIDASTLIVMLSIAGLFVAIIGGLLLSRSFFPPLHILCQSMEFFSSGQLDHRIKEKMPAEFQKLAHGFNAMAEKLQKTHSELEKQSIQDSLTICFNRRKFVLDLATAFARACRYQKPLSLLLIDLDHFKSVNDTYGHLAGDHVLKEVANTMHQQLRSTDTLYRYGGEEFTALLPETNQAGAHIIAERIREHIAKTPIHVNNSQYITVTTSIGLACYPQDTTNQRELIEKADHAVYMAKKSGRNRVCHDTPPSTH